MEPESPPKGAAPFAAVLSLLWSVQVWFAAMFGGDGDGAIEVGLLLTLVPLGGLAIAVSFTKWSVQDKRTIQRNLLLPSILYGTLMIGQLRSGGSALILQ